MIAPLLTFALQAATYQLGMPTHNYNNNNKKTGLERHTRHHISTENSGVRIQALWCITPVFISSFCYMKQLGVLLLA